MTAFGFVVVCLAATRITRLITEDDITEPIREWASDWNWVYKLVTCPWCIGFWISLVIVAAWWTTGPKAEWLLAPFAVSYVAGRLNQ